jgi:hypothetical protein
MFTITHPAGRTTATAARAIAVGARVRIERDETRYPSRGTWPEFRGRVGVVVEINAGEYGVIFGATRRRANRPVCAASGEAVTTWFRAYEIRAICRGGAAPVRHADASLGRTLVGVS